MLPPQYQNINPGSTGIGLFLNIGLITNSFLAIGKTVISSNAGLEHFKYTSKNSLIESGFHLVSTNNPAALTYFNLILLFLFLSVFGLLYWRNRKKWQNIQGKKSELLKFGEISKEHERRLSSLISNLPGFVYRCKNDEHWTMLYISERCKQITGYSQDDLLNNNKISFSQIIKPGYRPAVEREWNKSLISKSPFTEEYEILTAENETKWLLERGVGIYDESGKLLFLEGYIEDISEQKTTQLKLIENEEKFRNLFHNHSAAKLLIDPENGCIIDANKAAADFYGWSIRELKQMKISHISVIPEKEAFYKMSVEMDNNSIPVEITHKKINGELVIVEVFISKVKLGKKIYLHSIVHDITEKRQAEKLFRESEELNRLIMDNSMDAILLTKPDGSIVSANNAACEMFGMSEQELILVGRDGVVDLQDTRLNLLLKQREQNGLVKGELNFLRKDGTKFPVDMTSSIFRNNKGEFYSSMILRDITQRKQTEDELKNSNDFNKSLMKTIPFAMNIVDENGVILFQNEKHQRLYGGIINEHRCYELLRNDKSRCQNCPLITGLELGVTKTIESNGIVGGRTFQITHTGMMFNGKKSILEIFQDITERKSWETKLLEAKNKAEINDRLKTAFLANMSHEIRTPMNGILGFISLLNNPDLNEKIRQEHHNIIKESGQRLLDTINDIIEISKIEAGELDLNYSLVNLTEIMPYYCNFFKPQIAGKEIEMYIPEQVTGEAALINTDKSKLDSILLNLIKNAVKFTLSGHIQIGNYLHENELIFYVKDTGQGIPYDKTEVVFERFVQADMSTTRAYEGSGIGLSIAKANVEALGGKIWFESEVNKGSTFFFSIPYDAVIHNVLPESETYLNSGLKKKSVLIAEDDEISYLYLEFILNEKNIPVIRTLNGKETVEFVQTNPDIALILMDIKMPEMDGIEATTEIRKFNQKVPIIAQTAYALPGDKEKAFIAGCNDYITKPVEEARLIKLIGKYLNN